MQNRKLGIIVASLGCAAIVGASYHAIPEQNKFDGESRYWISKGIDPNEGKKVDHMAYQMSSDYCHKRPVSEGDQAYLLKTVEKGGPLASEVYWHALSVKETAFSSTMKKFALKAAKSLDEDEAIAALEYLKFNGDYRWKALAQSHSEKPGECMALLIKESNE